MPNMKDGLDSVLESYNKMDIPLDLLEVFTSVLFSWCDKETIDTVMQLSKDAHRLTCGLMDRPELYRIWADVHEGIDSIRRFPREVVCRNVRVSEMTRTEVIRMLEYLVALKATVFNKVERLEIVDLNEASMHSS